MKTNQKGSMAILLILFIIVIGGGVGYVYKVKHDASKISQQSEVKSESDDKNDSTAESAEGGLNVNTSIPGVKEVEIAANTNIKTFTSFRNLYSFNHPENWVFKHNTDTGTDDYCLSNPNTYADAPCFSVAASQYTDYAPPLTSAVDSNVKQVTIGKNPFAVSISTNKGITNEYYELPIGVANERNSYIGVSITNSAKFNRSEINLVLSTIKVGSSATGINKDNVVKAVQDIEARTQFINFKPNAKLFYSHANSYVGMCDPLASDGNRHNNYGTANVLLKVREIAASHEMYCDASKESYILYSRLNTGVYLCTDSTTEYLTESKTKPSSMVCK